MEKSVCFMENMEMQKKRNEEKRICLSPTRIHVSRSPRAACAQRTRVKTEPLNNNKHEYIVLYTLFFSLIFIFYLVSFFHQTYFLLGMTV